MPTSYEDDAALTGPAWLRRRVGRAWRGAVGLAADWALSGLKQAVKARFVASAPADALAWLGDERTIVAYPGDTVETHRARVAAAWELWQHGGEAQGILAALAACGFHNAALYTARSAAPPGEGTWPPDSNPGNWSRFWILLDVTAAADNPFDWQPVLWGARNWGDGWTWGSSATLGEVQLVRGIIRTWKCATEICGGILVDLPGGERVRWEGM